MKKKYLLLMFIIMPLMIGAQFDILEDDFLFDDNRGETFTESLLAPIVGAFSDDLEFRVDIYANRTIYDLVGNFVFFGYPFFKINHSRFENHKAYIYTGRWRKEFKAVWWDTKWLSWSSIGIRFSAAGLTHSMRAGTTIPLMFTPMTFKRTKLFGLRYDIKRGEAIKIKSFVTTRFKENRFIGHNSKRIIELKDKVLYAVRPVINIGEIHDSMPDFLQGQYLGVNLVNNQLRNGFYDDETGLREEFFVVYSEDEKREADRGYTNGEIIINYETLLGADLTGKISTTKYYLEYVHNRRKDHKILDVEKGIVTTNETTASALIFNLRSRDILKNILEEPKFEIEVEAWHIGSNYGAEWAMDDDDDNDGWADDSLKYHDPFFPYERGDGRYTEPQSGVIYKNYNRNLNAIPDYKEDFLLFNVDQYFEETMVFEDPNYNGIMDYDENDLDPDFPYDRDRQGWRGYFGLNPFGLGTFLVGGSYNRTHSIITNPNVNTATSRLFGYKVDKEFFDVLAFNGELLFERVHDNIPDDYVSFRDFAYVRLQTDLEVRDNFTVVEDNLAFRDNSIYKVQIGLGIIRYENLVAHAKIRRTHNTRHFDNVYNKFYRDIFKASYSFHFTRLEQDYDWFHDWVGWLSPVVLTPQFKFEKGMNRYFNEDMSEKYVMGDTVLLDQREYFSMMALIFIARYNFSEYIYLIGGVQSKLLNDLYKPRNSSDKIVYAVQLVMSRMRLLKGKRGTSFFAGYKKVREKFNVGGRVECEDTIFGSILTAF